MGDAPEMVKVRHIGNCLKADPAYGKGVATALEFRSAKLASKYFLLRIQSARGSPQADCFLIL